MSTRIRRSCHSFATSAQDQRFQRWPAAITTPAPGSFFATLTPRTHTITASVSDSDINEDLDTVQLLITVDGCSDHVVLANEDIAEPRIEKARFTITLGPALTVDDTGDLTLHASQSVILSNGAEVLANGTLVAELTADSCN